MSRIFNIGTQPLKQGDKWSTNGIKYTAETNTTSVGQAYECDSGLVEGQNMWNEITELGSINNSSGNLVSSSNSLRSRDYTIVEPNTTYIVSATQELVFAFYDSNKSNIPYVRVNGEAPVYGVLADVRTDTQNQALWKFTTPNNTKYIRFANLSGTTYNNDIAIYEGSTARAYTPHIADEVATHYLHCDKVEQVRVKDNSGNVLATTTPNAYLPSGQVQNNLHSSDWIVKEAWGLDWSYQSQNYRFKASLENWLPTNATERLNISCDFYTPSSAPLSANTDGDLTICGYQNTNAVYLRDLRFTDVATFKQFLQANNVLICFKKADTSTKQTITTPSTKTMSAPQQVEIVGKHLSIKVAQQR